MSKLSIIARQLMKVAGVFGITLVLSACGFFQNDVTKISDTTSQASFMRGVNIMDLGQAGSAIPGTFGVNYTKPSLATFQYLKSRGLKVVRLPFLWERVQPTLNGALDTTYLGYIIEALENANTAGLKVILDMHNYGGYSIGGAVNYFGRPAGATTSAGPTKAQFADVWVKLSTAIQANTNAKAGLYAYDIMNEPINMLDSRGMVSDTGATTLASFSTTDEGWTGSYSATVSQNALGAGSLKIDGSVSAGSYGIAGAYINGLTLDSNNGLSVRIKGHIPNNFQGDNLTLKLTTWTGWTPTVIGTKSVIRGDIDVSFTLTSAQWVGATGFIVDLVMNNPDGVGPYTWYITEVTQGNAITGQSAESLWEEVSQHAVTAIRNNGDTSLLMVEGYAYAPAGEWSTYHPTAWITDPADNMMYQAHCYFDTGSGGLYSLSFADETTNATGAGYASVSDRTVARLKAFGDWVSAQGVRGYIGEIGWPNSVYVSNSDSTNWNLVGEAAFNYLDSINMGATMWATGSWLGNGGNINNVYDLGNSAGLSQASVLEAHVGP